MKSNRISRQLEEYLEYKHSLGYRLTHEEYVLRNFVNYTLEIGYTGSLNSDIVLDWISSGSDKDKTMGRKLEVIRPFSKYISAFDSEAKNIPGKIFRNVHDRPEPYIYTENEVVTLMNACDSLFSPDGIRARSVKCIIGLLWATGMRPSEPIHLRVKDVDFAKQCIVIRETKYAKTRIIPVTASVMQEISDYMQWLTSNIGSIEEDEPLFRTTGGKSLSGSALSYAFQLIRASIQAAPKGYPNVRLYDFRHTFACNTILNWLRNGQDATALLYTLSVFLGHVKIEDTYWYLSATPALMNLSCSRYEKQFGGDYDD